METETLIEEKISDSGIDTEGGAHVILFNDDWHTFEEVIRQLMLATQCSLKKAKQHADEVHNSGKSKVFVGSYENCLEVSAVLEEIKLKTQIEFS
jgi:ATP-dependent Clp protease adaptor protein ClpS